MGVTPQPLVFVGEADVAGKGVIMVEAGRDNVVGFDEALP